jgi:hypothetical protein
MESKASALGASVPKIEATLKKITFLATTVVRSE